MTRARFGAFAAPTMGSEHLLAVRLLRPIAAMRGRYREAGCLSGDWTSVLIARAHRMWTRSSRQRLLVGAVAAIAASTGCELSRLGGIVITQHCGYSATIFVATAEGDATRHLLSVGDTGWAATQVIDDNCVAWTTAPIYSSDSSVLTLAPGVADGHGNTVAIIAKAPGSTVLTVDRGGIDASARIEVVPAPLPIDSISVRWGGRMFGADSVLAAVTDSAGNLISLTLPVRGGATLVMTGFRNGNSTVYLPVALASSDSAVASVGCLCDWPSEHQPCGGVIGGVSGQAAGTSTVTVTARQYQRSFLVTVR